MECYVSLQRVCFFLPKEGSTYCHFFKKQVLEKEMSFRNSASSHLNDNVGCYGDQMFRSQRDEWHLTK